MATDRGGFYFLENTTCADAAGRAMSHEPFTILFEQDRRLLNISLRGLWDLAQVQHYEDSVRSMVRDIMRSGVIRQFDVLVDLREHAVQTRDVAEALQGVVGRIGDGVARLALVTSSSSLQKMQATRLGQSSFTRFFSSMEDADSWLAD